MNAFPGAKCKDDKSLQESTNLIQDFSNYFFVLITENETKRKMKKARARHISISSVVLTQKVSLSSFLTAAKNGFIFL